ncbi:MAG TPA: VOC family protein [Streptosporangiaceae bacterium]|nr:VOC family protein [Streptosporangiaceae bacterium]
MSHTPHRYLRGDLVVVIDVGHLDRAADFWSAVLGYAREGAGGDRYLSLLPAGGAGAEILLQRVPDAKPGKNRMHLDLRTHDLEAEVSRVTGLGATVLTAEPVTESGWRWHILADPDGNEFCVLQPPASYWPG